MAQEIIQQREQFQMDGMQNVDIQTEDHCLVNINRIKELLPQSGFDGLTELLGLLEETQALWMQEEPADAAQSADRVPMLNEILLLAEQHLEQNHSDEIIDNLILGIADICTDVNLVEDDLAMLKELLHDDGAEQVPTPVTASSELSNVDRAQEINQYQEQLNQFIPLAEAQGLSGIQDILLALKDWFEWQYEQDQDGGLFNQKDITALEQLTSAVTAYISLENTNTAVQQLFEGIGQLHGEPIIPLEDIEEFSQVLIDEISIQSNS
ncbi:MAG: hypothetical protein V3V22_02180, partial [Methylococcales bacterium]